jgi:hypothetical protein
MSPMSPRLLRPRAPGTFNPRSIANLAGWWDFNDAATVTVATGISAITDKSGNGRTLTQSTINNRPAWTANVLNGKHAAVFDGNNDTLGASFTLAQAITVFCVGRFTNPTGGHQLFDGFAGGNRMRLFASSTTQINLFAGSQVTGPNTTLNAHSVWETVFNGASSLIIRNGSELASGNAGTAQPDGIYLSMFGNGFSNPTPSEIAHVLVYARFLSASERSAVRKWLGSLYAITVA